MKAPPPPPGISIIHCMECLSYPPSPWNFCKFSTLLGTLWKVYLCQKYCCTVLLSAKDNFSEIRCLINSRTFLANNEPYIEAIPYTTDYMNNAIFIRTSFIETKHQVNFHYFISVRTCYKKASK